MPAKYKYAMKLGEVYLESNEPITPEQYKTAVSELNARDNILVEMDGNDPCLRIVSAVNRH